MAAAPTGSYADYVARREERLARKSTRYGVWAEKRIEKKEEVEARYHQIADIIPFGQPILVGHHSEGRHRRDLDRLHNLAGKEIEHIQKAEKFAHKSEACAAALEQQTNPAFCARRIEEAEVGIRKAQKELLIPPWSGDKDAHIAHWTGWLAHYQEQLAFWTARLESAGGLPVSREEIKKGSWAEWRTGEWCEILKINKKTVTLKLSDRYQPNIPISELRAVQEAKPE